VIERIKHFESELQTLGFSESPQFLDSHIPVGVSRRAEIRKIPWSISKGKGCWLCESCGVDPIIDSLMGRHRISDNVRTLIPAKRIGVIRGWRNRKRETGLRGHNSG